MRLSRILKGMCGLSGCVSWNCGLWSMSEWANTVELFTSRLIDKEYMERVGDDTYQYVS